MTSIVSDGDIQAGSPRIEGTRITVLDVKHRVVDNDEDPHVVAGEYDLSAGDIFYALSYYYDHRESFREREREAEQRRREGERENGSASLAEPNRAKRPTSRADSGRRERP